DGVNAGTDPQVEPQFAVGKQPVISAPTVDCGSDGEHGGGGIAYSLTLGGGNGVDSGLATTNGDPILLYVDAAGRVVGVYDGNGANGAEAFAIHINPTTGVVSVAQYVSLEHPDDTNPDDAV